MKALKVILGSVLLLMVSVITFYTFNLVFTVVANHQALDLVSLSGLPMLFIDIMLVALVVAAYRVLLRKSCDVYFLRFYAYLCGALGLLTIVFSIINGTVVYGSFVKDYVFIAYPLITLIIGILTVAGCTYIAVTSEITIRKEHPVQEFKVTFLFSVKTIGISILLLYALERLGGFVLLPVYYSSYDGIYTLPYVIQLLVPAVIMFNYAMFEFMKHGSRKVPLISSGIVFGYTVASLIYVILMAKNTYPLMLNSITVVQQFERLVRYPIDAILLYGVSLLMPGYSLVNQLIKVIKEKKAK